jgi:hypothetical protein
MIYCGSYWAVPPLLAAAYCLLVWMRKSGGRGSWMGFFATTMAALFFFTLPTMLAILLPIIALMNQMVSK